MTEQQQSFTYHSLHRHVQSIVPQYENKDNQMVYSSNKQPLFPSILQRSRQKKSHEKSLKKGISRVSKSKKDLMQNMNQAQTKEIDTGKTTLLSKGTLLDFNLQEVVENKYHLTKPKDQIADRSPLYVKIKQEQKVQRSAYGSGQKSFINQYRIVTYVPPGYVEQKNLQSKEKNEIQSINKQLFSDKENNLNQSNIQYGNHKKNESQEIHITNQIEEQILQLNTWRTSQNNDPYYSNNFKTEMNRTSLIKEDQNVIRNESLYVPFQQRYSIPLTVNMQEVTEDRQKVTEELKEKIRHLQHEIVSFEREKNALLRENQSLKQDNEHLNDENRKIQSEMESTYTTIIKLQEKTGFQEQEIRRLQHQLSLIEQNSKKLSQSQLYQQQPLQKANNQFLKPKDENDLLTKIEELEILNATLSKQLSQRSLIITDLNRKNRDLTDKLAQIERLLKKSNEKEEDREQQIAKKNQTIVQLQKKLQDAKQALRNYNRSSYTYQTNIEQKSQQANQLSSENYSQKGLKQLQKQLQQVQQKYEQKLRDYNHLQKKHNFMKDQLQHLKYLQNNGSSSYRSVSNNLNKSANLSINKNNTTNNHQQQQKSEQLQQYISELQTRLQITQRNLNQTQHEYSNLKQNFRALQQLYIKQQQQFDQTEQQLLITEQENKKLIIQLNNQQEINKMKTNRFNEEYESVKLIQKDQIIVGLKRELNLIERDKFEMLEAQKYLERQLQELNEKYLKEVEKSTQFSLKYKADLALFTEDVQKQQQQKTSLIVLNYETLITKLNQQISHLKQQLETIKDKNLKELIKLEDLHKTQIQQLKDEQRYFNYQKQNILREKQIYSYENRVREEKIYLEKSHRKNVQAYLGEEIEAKKELQLQNKTLNQECANLEDKCLKLQAQNERIQDYLQENKAKIISLQQNLQYFNDQTENSKREKLQLTQQIERLNKNIVELRKVNNLFEEQRFMFNRQLDDLSVKYTVCIKENQTFLDEIKVFKKKLSSKQIESQNFESTLRQLRIALLEEKQLSEKRLNIIESAKVESENHRSKEQYYKMMHEKTQRQLQLSKQQYSLLLLQKQQKSLKSSPVKRLSPVKKNTLQIINDQIIVDTTAEVVKSRQTQLYRIQIYKDLNALLSLTLQNFTFQQVLEKNQQQYLRKLFNAIKQDHDKLIELKQLIVAMQEGFKQQKVHIKQDYDLVYEKYLKYKSMCQAMEKDIERYKLKLKKKDENFASIRI